jgi:hypothetical protein
VYAWFTQGGKKINDFCRRIFLLNFSFFLMEIQGRLSGIGLWWGKEEGRGEIVEVNE